MAIGAGIAVVLARARRALQCPTAPDDPVCRPWSAVLLPTAYGGMYMRARDGTYFGGGVEAVLLAWSDNSPAFGPSQGRIARRHAALDRRRMRAATGDVRGRRAGRVRAQRVARVRLIPYFAADVGGLWSEATGRRWFVDGGLGVYLCTGAA